MVSWVTVEDPMSVVRDERSEAFAMEVLDERLAADGRIRTGLSGRPDLELVVIADGTGGASGAGTKYTLRTSWGDGWRLAARARGGSPVPREDLARVVDGLIDDLVSQVALFGMDSVALVEMLEGDPSGGNAATAVRILGERRAKVAVPVLTGMLESAPRGSEMVADLVGALGRISDERASHALIEAFHDSDPGMDVAIVDALGRTGGREAMDFLEVLATGHPDQSVREEAAEKLGRMRGGAAGD